MSTPSTAVVILNYNGQPFLARFLPTVLAHTPPMLAHVIVADNASTDHSVAWLNTQHPEVRLITLLHNGGFAQGYNEALSQLEGQYQYYVLLNSDVATTPHWLDPLVAHLESHPTVAACQPKIKATHTPTHFEYAGAGGGWIDRWGYPFCRGRIFDTLEADEGQYDDTVPVFWASGAALCIRADCFHKIGGFDARFFAHMEEIDLCWRLQRQGYGIYYVGSSTVYHVGGGTLPKASPTKTYLNFRNNLAMLAKNLPTPQVYSILGGRLVLDAVAAARFATQGQWPMLRAVGRAYLHAYRQWRTWRRYAPTKKHPNSLHGYYPGSIVWQYFARGRRHFSQLAPKNQDIRH
ncbi:glycosyltransferase family 2 protein [Eisenibacter elegans]|uniref:glycosyltransferase family 2 protein n=1 Tax=Eisenibacter elegans TaxID=997 RepID=UPI000402CBC7|nr:glycosyltransferase family 2 protein [Eisenibacter elegans]